MALVMALGHATVSFHSQEGALAQIFNKECRECGAGFQAERISRRYCSNRCAATVGRRSRWEKSKATLEERFWLKVDKRGEDECWPWTGFRHKNYGRMKGVTGDAAIGAHRVSYMIHHGPIPDGLTVLHRCDNPPCCNPKHLFAGTNIDNNLDRDAKGRGARGERAFTAKLTNRKVRIIRAADPSDYATLARRYGVLKRSIQLAATGKSWSHVK